VQTKCRVTTCLSRAASHFFEFVDVPAVARIVNLNSMVLARVYAAVDAAV
jgi:hypothetical protein